MSNSSPEGFSYFAEIAASYDRVQSVLSPPYERGLETIVELVPFDPDEPFDFVDLGCGTAEPSARVLDCFGRSTAVCIDSEPEMLRDRETKTDALSRKNRGKSRRPHRLHNSVLRPGFLSEDLSPRASRSFAVAHCANRGRASSLRLFHSVRYNVGRARLVGRGPAAGCALPRAPR